MTAVTTQSGDDQSKYKITESQRKVAISLLLLGERHEIIAKATGLSMSMIAKLSINHKALNE